MKREMEELVAHGNVKKNKASKSYYDKSKEITTKCSKSDAKHG
jgi:hypothetical protein